MGIGSSSKSSGSVKSFADFQFDGRKCAWIRHGSASFLKSIKDDPGELVDQSVITKIEIWKVPLIEWIPFDIGLFYHAFLVFETKTVVNGKDANLRWSFEKDAEKISLQYSSIHSNSVIDKFGRNKRLPKGLWKPQKLDEYELKQEMPMEKIFSVYLDTGNSEDYKVITKNCQIFAKDIFNNISKKYRSDCKAYRYGFRSYVRDFFSRPVGLIANICIRLQMIGFCYLNSMFVTMYWSLFITELTCLYGSNSKF